MRKCQGNAPKARGFPYVLHSGHMTAALQPQAASNVCGFWLSSVCRTAGSDINGDWVEFMWKRQWWLIKWKDFGGSGKADWIPIYPCNHILLQGQRNRVAASIVVMEKIVGFASTATNAEVISLFASLISDYKIHTKRSWSHLWPVNDWTHFHLILSHIQIIQIPAGCPPLQSINNSRRPKWTISA